uniref:ATP-binding cassette sub-family G member 8 n=3 Tax=Lygus hesperus TaxID=30085 RepID=A0A146KVC2_LYGHE
MPEAWEMEQRRYSIAGDERLPPPSRGMIPSTSEDLHAWSIYRQNLNSDFTDSALGSSEKSPLPYGNFQLRESTVQSILNHPRYGPKSPLGANMYTYLKFGLPRVFPPNEGGGNSSGYNSSNEGADGGGGGGRGLAPPPHVRKGRPGRSTSEADFTNLHYHHPTTTLGRSGKSYSQADLLNTETLMRQAAAQHRRSLHDLRHTEYLAQALLPRPPHHPHPAVMGSQQHLRHHPHHQSGRIRRASTAQGHAQSVLPSPEPFSFSMLHPQQYSGLYPYLQIRNMNIRNRKGEPMINSLSTEVKAGEILSIMCTNSSVGTCLLEALCGRRSYSGQVTLNGLEVGRRELSRTCAIVRKGAVLHGDLSVAATLRYYAALRRPPGTRGKMSMADQVSIVTEELGLSPVLDTRVSELTPSEVSRLLVALQLLADPQILLVDDVTQPMDIFDTFFLVEFLRYWAAGATGGVAGRIVVMCLQPPTYEILTMVSRLLILSGPDTMYDGPARSLAHYFTPVQCPAPSYKNPADYYLDLVTLDDLSAEAMLESSQRVDQLAALYRRRVPPLTDVPPYTLPSPFKTPWIFSQAFTILLRDCYYSQPVSFTCWILRVIVAALVSVIIGAIFWDIPSSDPQLVREERLGYHFTILCVTSWPLAIVLGTSRTHGRERAATESDFSQGLYSRFVYIFTTLIFSLIPSSLIWLAYLIPAYCMSGLYDQMFSDNLANYLGVSLLCLLGLQYSCTLLGCCAPVGRGWTLIAYTLVHVLLSSTTGYPIATNDALLPPFIAAYAPVGSAYRTLVIADYSPAVLKTINSHLVCRNKQVQRQDIIVHLPCPVPNGTQALEYHGILADFRGANSSTGLVVQGVFLASTAVLAALAYMVSPFIYGSYHEKRNLKKGR